MKKSESPLRGTNWSIIFDKRPDLIPPGYQELLNQIRQDKTNEQNEEDGKRMPSLGSSH